mgnify:CR=1|tara:strand:- start:10 stop:651 length:642 start_codon:yes stop_codon:yes gene_type:complete
MAKTRKNNKYKSKKRRDKRRNKKTKRLKKNRKSKLNNKFVSYQKGGDDIRVEGGVGTVVAKFFIYKDKYMRPFKGSERILYIVQPNEEEETAKFRMYFSQRWPFVKIGDQLEQISGSSPPMGNIQNWKMELEEGPDKKVGDKRVHSIIKLSPITVMSSSIFFGKNEYEGHDGKRYNVPITFGLSPNVYNGYTDIGEKNNSLLEDLRNKCGVID